MKEKSRNVSAKQAKHARRVTRQFMEVIAWLDDHPTTQVPYHLNVACTDPICSKVDDLRRAVGFEDFHDKDTTGPLWDFYTALCDRMKEENQ